MAHTDQEIKETLRALNELAKISGMSVECVALRDGDFIYAAWNPAVVQELRAGCQACIANAEEVCVELRARILSHVRED